MKKRFLLSTILTTLATSSFSLHSAASEFKPYTPYTPMPAQQALPPFGSQLIRAYTRDLLADEANIPAFASREALESLFASMPYPLPYSFEQMLPDIAREATLHGKKVTKDMHRLLWLKRYIEGVSVQDMIGAGLIHNLAKQKLSHNFINDLTGIQALSDAESIDLSFNNIKTLQPHTFAGLDKLKRLILNENNLKDIPAGTFSKTNLPSLQYLDLADNRISESTGKRITAEVGPDVRIIWDTPQPDFCWLVP